jgi:hypothetical protein
MGEKNREHLVFNLRHFRTGEPITFTIHLGKVKIPHGVDLSALTGSLNRYMVDYTGRPIGGDSSYGGMNYYAAKELGVPFDYPKDVVLIAKQTTGDPTTRYDKLNCTIAHEIIEAELMSTGLPYHIAHMYAMEYEKGIDKDPMTSA